MKYLFALLSVIILAGVFLPLLASHASQAAAPGGPARFFRSPLFAVGLWFTRLQDRCKGRGLAINVLLTPHETSRGTQSMDADTGVLVAGYNAVVKIGSDDRHFALPSAATDIPLGIIQQDSVDAGEPGVIRKVVCLFGLYPESLPANTTVAIAASADLVADPANPGNVIPLPGTTGTYYVFGRARYTVPAGGGPVSIIHHVARKVVI